MGRFLLFVTFLFTLNLNYSSAQTSYLFNINNISLPLDNKGVLGDVNISPEPSGGYFAGQLFLYSGGFLLSGKSNNTIWSNGVASASLINDYQPGNVDSSSTNSKYVIYNVYKDEVDFAPSWTKWKDAVETGADFHDGNSDGIYNPIDLNSNGTWDPNEDRPDMMGDLTLWCVYNDGVLPQLRRFNDVEPQGIEIHQSVFAFNSGEAVELNNIIFIRYRLINTGKVTDKIDSVYFCSWADTDLGYLLDDLAAYDSNHQAGFIYNFGSDVQYGNNPPAHFIKQLQGPFSFIPGETFTDNNSNGTYDHGIDMPLDTAFNFKGKYNGIEIIPGAKNLSLTSFIPYTQSDAVHGDPSNSTEARYYLMGFDKHGDIIDPCNWSFGTVQGGVDCSQVNPFFMYSGDPVTQTGWINNFPNDLRQMLNTGPFILNEGEPVDIIVAYIVGRGTDALNSITESRSISSYSKYFYNSNFGQYPLDIKENSSIIANNYHLFQNYPNPFNPETKIEFYIPEPGFTSLKVYDILGKEIAELVNDDLSSGKYEVTFDGNSFSSGTYFYKLISGDETIVKKMLLVK